MADLRATLETIAEGRRLADVFAEQHGTVIDAAAVDKDQPAFNAWRSFAMPARGEPLPAPAELLTPLP